MSERIANISTSRQQCEEECAQTWTVSHGEALPGGPFPGRFAEPGDVRLCKHGRIWVFSHNRGNFDHWNRLLWLFEPIAMWRARRALASAPADEGVES